MRNFDWDLFLTVLVAVSVTIGIVILISCGPSLDAVVFGR